MEYFLFLIFQFLATFLGMFLAFRTWLQYHQVQPSIEVATFVIKITNPWVVFWQSIFNPLRWRPYQISLIATWLFALSVVIVHWIEIRGIIFDWQSIPLIVLISWVLCINWWLWAVMLCLLADTLLSWVGHTRKSQWVSYSTQPILKLLRKYISPIGSIDFVPMLVFIVFNLLSSALNKLFEYLLRLT